MDMQINIELIKSQRNKRAWSQTHLAEVSGLSLRTIQRIEKTGAASLESVKSIASAFEVSVTDLQGGAVSTTDKMKYKLSAFIGAVIISLSSFFVVTATAQSIMVDVELSSSGSLLSKNQMVNEENEENVIIISDMIKVRFTAENQGDGTILISTKLYDLSKGQETLISSPSLTIEDGETAGIRSGGYSLSLTPNL